MERWPLPIQGNLPQLRDPLSQLCLPSCGNQHLHKTPGKSVTGYTELMGSLCEKKGTEKSQVFPWLAPGAFPGTLGPPLGAGCLAPASLMGPASIDGALAAPRDADAATVGNLNSHPPITLPWLGALPLSLAGTPFRLPPPRSQQCCQRQWTALNPWETIPRRSRIRSPPPVPPLPRLLAPPIHPPNK